MTVIITGKQAFILFILYMEKRIYENYFQKSGGNSISAGFSKKEQVNGFDYGTT
ncbi:hypothetical protein SD77_3929 [Bacillus badius]|uniref:Uncharacterized protein n=1 Tax=Bacillus badius TaxID=1455 RepID=A0ABR5AUC8_BACBA|nr:hypothetical protein SD78_0920 [Bacillus badius]KIL78249.1 hypothetical protein SD77_3929 [Bacillus badius]